MVINRLVSFSYPEMHHRGRSKRAVETECSPYSLLSLSDGYLSIGTLKLKFHLQGILTQSDIVLCSPTFFAYPLLSN